MVPIDAELAAHGVCSNCKQAFEDDQFYCQVSFTGSTADPFVYMVICIGCAAQLACLAE